jgi:hypothetical protein
MKTVLLLLQPVTVVVLTAAPEERQMHQTFAVTLEKTQVEESSTMEKMM